MHHPVIHIVKRFGRVGGMESYVWHLVHGLARKGIFVVVVCEEICEQPQAAVQVLKVEKSMSRPRWKSMKVFRELVDREIRQKFNGRAILVHSHERALCHQVSTFHGPPIQSCGASGWLQCFNRRLNNWRKMEYEEVLGDSVQVVLAVSTSVQKCLRAQYPSIDNKILDIAWPGTSGPNNCKQRPLSGVRGANILFVGKEWKRKGLALAVDIVREYRKESPEARLTVFGVDRKALPNSISGVPWVTVVGWANEIPWSQFDLLIHPAKNEPFGMVVAEARSNGLPVLMSSMVGAAELDFCDVKVIDVTSPPLQWCNVISDLISGCAWRSENKWSWSDLVNKHIEVIYPKVNPFVP